MPRTGPSIAIFYHIASLPSSTTEANTPAVVSEVCQHSWLQNWLSCKAYNLSQFNNTFLPFLLLLHERSQDTLIPYYPHSLSST